MESASWECKVQEVGGLEVWRFGGLDPPLPIPPACSTEGKMTAWKK